MMSKENKKAHIKILLKTFFESALVIVLSVLFMAFNPFDIGDNFLIMMLLPIIVCSLIVLITLVKIITISLQESPHKRNVNRFDVESDPDKY